MATDWRKVQLTPADYRMLEFGEKLTLLPSTMTEEDVSDLRRHDFTDRDILAITLVVAFRNFIIRIADSLGVELSPTNGTYHDDILDAYGVNREYTGSTIYADRLTAQKGQREKEVPAPGAHGRPQVNQAQEVCWLSTSSSHAGKPFRELEQLTQPHPLRNLGLALGLRPEALQVTVDIARVVGMGGSGLGRRMEAIIGLVVAATAWTNYMGVHHAQALMDAGGTLEEVQALVDDPSGGNLTGQERLVAYYCEKLTRFPTEIVLPDIDVLRRSNLDDIDILTIATSASLENFLCRVAAGLGVCPEEDTLSKAAIEVFGG